MRSNRLYQKLFLSPYFFTIAIRKKKPGNIWEGRSFRPDYVMPSTYNRWAADPILFDHDGQTFLFFEAVDRQHGHLEVCRVYDDCTLSDSVTVLKDSCHYSYPFLFQAEGAVYMIPESSGAGEVRLYKAEQFPEKWSLVTVLMKERAVDTTVFEYGGKLYLMTFITDGRSERVIPRIFHFELLQDGAALSEMEWSDWDALHVRGAGPVIRAGERRIRPVQISQEQRYGDAVAFMESHVNGETYSETEIGRLTEKQILYKRIFIDGLHTYSSSGRFEAIDVRCRAFELFKVRRLLKKAALRKQKPEC